MNNRLEYTDMVRLDDDVAVDVDVDGVCGGDCARSLITASQGQCNEQRCKGCVLLSQGCA